jgi:predicted ATPase
MLKSISLENFKCFEHIKLDISPLTILCGINSSGKSSVINSLLMLKQSYEDNVMANNMRFNGKYIKCGSFEDVSTDRNNEPIKFEIEYELRRPEKYKKQSRNSQSKTDIAGYKALSKLFQQSSSIEKITVKSTIILKKNKNGNNLKDNVVDRYNLILTPYSKQIACEIVNISLRHVQDKIYSITIENVPNSLGNQIVPKIILEKCVCYFENLTLINAYATSVFPKNTKIDGVLANIYLIFRINAMQFKNIKYLTPLRVYPQPNYIIDNETDSVGLSGEYTPHIMYKYSGRKILGFVPPKEEIIAGKEEKKCFEDLVNLWMEYLGLGEYTLKQTSEMVKLNVADYNISNVGFGVSQVLPILVSGLIERKDELLMLEQPEIHLHPAAQMAIADFLLSMAANQRGLIIETHSDHIINRVVKRVLQDKSGQLNRIIKIYYVNGEEREKPITEIIIDPQKGIINAPTQFFTQFGSESMMIAKCAMENYREGVKW